MAYQFVKYEKKGPIAYITLNRPEVMNALHPPSHLELGEIYEDVAADPEIWVAILTGAGSRAFSAGNDLKATAAAGRAPAGSAPATPTPAVNSGGFGGNTARFNLVKPLIAAVNGWAMGGGCEMALASDIIIAAEHAQFGLPEPKVGLMAGAGGVHRLPRQIPLKRAMGMILTGKPISAKTALEWGLVNEVVPMDQLIPTAEKWARDIMACSPLSVRASKEASMKGLDIPLEQALGTRFPASVTLFSSEDLLEGPRAFAEKREPQWKGR